MLRLLIFIYSLNCKSRARERVVAKVVVRLIVNRDRPEPEVGVNRTGTVVARHCDGDRSCSELSFHSKLSQRVAVAGPFTNDCDAER